jgi:hypothetical protein
MFLFSFLDTTYMGQVSSYARSVQRTQMQTIRDTLGGANSNSAIRKVLSDMVGLANNIEKMRYPFEDPPN